MYWATEEKTKCIVLETLLLTAGSFLHRFCFSRGFSVVKTCDTARIRFRKTGCHAQCDAVRHASAVLLISNEICCAPDHMHNRMYLYLGKI